MSAKMRQIEEAEEAFDAQRLHGQFPGRSSPGLRAAAGRWSEAVWSAAEQLGPLALEDKNLRAGLDLVKRPVFICGVHRSGTTLVRNLLDGHSALSVLPSEGSFLTSLQAKLARLPAPQQLPFFGQEWLRRLAIPSSQALCWPLGRTTHDRSPYVLFARRLIAWWHVAQASFASQHSLWPLMALALAYTETGHRDAGPPLHRWVEKTPTNEFYLDRLRREFPAAKCIQVVRNPLAVYASRKRVEERTRGNFLSVRTVLKDLARSFRIALEQNTRGNQSAYVMIRYEDLLAAPDRVTEQLAGFLEIEPSETLLCPTIMNIPVSPNSSFQSNQQRGRIIPADPGSQADGLSRSEQELVAAYTNQFAAQLGYTLPSLTPSRRLVRKSRLSVWHASWRVHSRFSR